jgi:transcription initiation factor TFIIB
MECYRCNGQKTTHDYKNAALICSGCGLIIEDRLIDSGPEWRAYDQKQQKDRARTGLPATYTVHDKGLSTIMGLEDQDFRGKNLTPRKRQKIHRLRKLEKQTRVSNTGDRSLVFGLLELERMSSHLGLPQIVREDAALTYRRFVKRGLSRGRSIEGVAAAALYVGCRKCKVPRMLKDIVNVSYVEERELNRNYQTITRELRIHPPSPNPIDYIPRFGSELGVSGETWSKAIKLIKRAKKKGLTISGREPEGIAGAALYIVSCLYGEYRTQRDVAKVACVTDVTLRNRHKEISKALRLNISL